MLHFGNFRLRRQQNCSLIYYRSPALKEPNSSDGSEDDPKNEPNAALHDPSLCPTSNPGQQNIVRVLSSTALDGHRLRDGRRDSAGVVADRSVISAPRQKLATATKAHRVRVHERPGRTRGVVDLEYNEIRGLATMGRKGAGSGQLIGRDDLSTGS